MFKLGQIEGSGSALFFSLAAIRLAAVFFQFSAPVFSKSFLASTKKKTIFKNVRLA